jgi:hypothetical protein
LVIIIHAWESSFIQQISDFCYSILNMKNTILVNLPKIGIRPTIDGRLGGVRESLEDLTMAQAMRVATLINSWIVSPSKSCMKGIDIQSVMAE